MQRERFEITHPVQDYIYYSEKDDCYYLKDGYFGASYQKSREHKNIEWGAWCAALKGQEVFDASTNKRLTVLQERIDELEGDYKKLIDSSLQQARMLIAQHKMLLDAGVECGSAATIRGMKEVEDLMAKAARTVDV